MRCLGVSALRRLPRPMRSRSFAFRARGGEGARAAGAAFGAPEGCASEAALQEAVAVREALRPMRQGRLTVGRSVPNQEASPKGAFAR